ncbi:MAG: HNH endonuclease [bacterium]
MATVDHIVPRSIGGSSISHKNMVVACQKCNTKKSNKIGYQDENGNWKF